MHARERNPALFLLFRLSKRRDCDYNVFISDEKNSSLPEEYRKQAGDASLFQKANDDGLGADPAI